MKIETSHTQAGCFLTLVGEATIYAAIELKERLLDALSATDEMELDLARVSEWDTAGLQVLLLVKRQAVAEGKTLRLVNHSPPVIELLELYALEHVFGDPLVIPAPAAL